MADVAFETVSVALAKPADRRIPYVTACRVYSSSKVVLFGQIAVNRVKPSKKETRIFGLVMRNKKFASGNAGQWPVDGYPALQPPNTISVGIQRL